MPLKKGTSRKTISANIETEMYAYEKTGKIGNSTPASKKKAQKQAVAIAYRKARESGAALPDKSSATKRAAAKSTTRKSTTKSTTARKRAS